MPVSAILGMSPQKKDLGSGWNLLLYGCSLNLLSLRKPRQKWLMKDGPPLEKATFFLWGSSHGNPILFLFIWILNIAKSLDRIQYYDLFLVTVIKRTRQSLNESIIHYGMLFAGNLEVNVGFWQKRHKLWSHDCEALQTAINADRLLISKMRTCDQGIAELGNWVLGTFWGNML